MPRIGWWLLVVAASWVWAAPRTARPMTEEERLARRGEYLVRITGCHDCHTPGASYGVPDLGRTLAGSDIGWRGPWGVTYPPNLTPDPTGLGGWSEEEIVAVLRTGIRPDGSRVRPPMPWQNLGALTDRDARAIATYLRRIPPIEHQVPENVPPGEEPSGPFVQLPPPPPPPAWDAPRW